MESNMNLHPCFRFNPFENELINMYLKPKVLGLNLPSDVVKERNLYGANPWQVFDPENYPWILNEVSPGKFEKLAYAFVNLTKKATNSNNNKSTVGRENYNKMAGCGVWAGKTPRTEIKDFDGKLIGERRMLSFKIKEVSDEEDSSRVGHWRMHEYNLCGINRNISNPSNIVLCRITLDHSKNAPIQNLHPDKTTHSIKATGEKNETKKNSVKMDVVVTDSVQTCHNDVQTCHNDDAEQTLTDDVLDDLLNRYVVEGEDGKATGEKNDTKKNSVKMDVVTDSVQTCHNDVQTCHNDDAEQTLTDDVLDDLLNRYVVEGEDGNYYCNMLDFEFRSNPELQVEQPLEDVTTNMGKRKLQAETSYVETGFFHDIPTTLQRSKADCPVPEEMITVSVDGSMLDQIAKIMSYLRLGSSGKVLKKKNKEKDGKELPMLLMSNAFRSKCALLYTSARQSNNLREEAFGVSLAGRMRRQDLDVAQMPVMSLNQWASSSQMSSNQWVSSSHLESTNGASNRYWLCHLCHLFLQPLRGMGWPLSQPWNIYIKHENKKSA